MLDDLFAYNCAYLKTKNNHSLCMGACVCVVVVSKDLRYLLLRLSLVGGIARYYQWTLFHSWIYVSMAHYTAVVYLQNIVLIFQQAFSGRKFHRKKKFKISTTLPCESLKRLLSYKKRNWSINLTLLKVTLLVGGLGTHPRKGEVTDTHILTAA